MRVTPSFLEIAAGLSWMAQAPETTRSFTTCSRTPSRRIRRSKITRSEEHTSELQSPDHLVCRLLLEKKKKKNRTNTAEDRAPHEKAPRPAGSDRRPLRIGRSAQTSARARAVSRAARRVVLVDVAARP